MSGHVHLSKAHGVNPGLLNCFVCGADIGIALHGVLPGDAEAPRHTTTPGDLCNSCKEISKTHVHLIEIEESRLDYGPRKEGRGDLGSMHAARTGFSCALREEKFTEVFNGPAVAWGLEHRMTFVSREALDKLGIPRTPPDNPAPENATIS